MSKRTISLIIALFIVTVLLLGIALSNSAKPQGENSTHISPTPTPYAQTSLQFSPATLNIPLGSVAPQTVTVVATTRANDITGVQLEISYDPKAITNVSIASGGMFTNPLIFNDKIDTINGRISYAYAITPSQQAKNGSGPVAVITFTPMRNAVDTNGQKIMQTKLSLLPKSVVTARGVDQSVLMQSSLANSATLLFNSAGPQKSLFSPPQTTTPAQ